MIPIDDFVQIGKALTKIENNQFSFTSQNNITDHNYKTSSNIINK